LDYLASLRNSTPSHYGGLLLAIVALGAILRIGWVLYVQTLPGSDFAQYDLLALRLAEGKGFVDQTGEPTAFYAIGWPFFLSVIYRIFGHSLVAAQLINALMGVGAVILTFAISRYLLDVTAALIATALVAVNPTLILYTSTHGTESLFVLEILLLTWLIMRVLASPNTVGLILVGVLTGVAVLTRPVAVCIPLAAFVAFFVMNRPDTRRTLKSVSVIVAVSALIVAPWIVRNAITVGVPSLQTTSGVVTWTGFNPQATGGFMSPPPIEGLTAIQAPGFGPETDEASANSAYMSATLKSLRANPIQVVALIPNKMFELWAGHRHAVKHSTRMTERSIPKFITDGLPILTQGYLVLLLLLVLAAFGMKHSRKFWLGGPGVVLTTAFVLWNVFHALTFGSGRYHVPLEPLLAIFAASAISAVLYTWDARQASSYDRNAPAN
jgi:4-amino-4-deoxy-L-arabinose transferase-like glycosyltransferase